MRWREPESSSGCRASSNISIPRTNSVAPAPLPFNQVWFQDASLASLPSLERGSIRLNATLWRAQPQS